MKTKQKILPILLFAGSVPHSLNFQVSGISITTVNPWLWRNQSAFLFRTKSNQKKHFSQQHRTFLEIRKNCTSSTILSYGLPCPHMCSSLCGRLLKHFFIRQNSFHKIPESLTGIFQHSLTFYSTSFATLPRKSRRCPSGSGASPNRFRIGLWSS